MPLNPSQTTAVLLAAGHGKRMLPLTQTTPKPLLLVGEHALIEHHLIRLKVMRFTHVVINIAYLAEKIVTALGDGSKYGLKISYSDESSGGALETAGGLKNALKLIESETFITINADIWTNFDYLSLLKEQPNEAKLVMVKNPAHNQTGDFAIDKQGYLSDSGEKLTFSGIACYRKSVFNSVPEGKQALAPVFRQLILKKRLQGIFFTGQWSDIGTPERLEELRNSISLQ